MTGNDEEEMPLQKRSEEQKKRSLSDFIKWYFHIDFKDITNYIALAIAVFLLWWGIKTILRALSFK